MLYPAPKKPKLKVSKGFTLAELLVSLLILAEITTFVIPKILNSQQNGRRIAQTKEAFATVSMAFQLYKQQNVLNADTNFGSIAPYINHLKIDTSSIIDGSRNDSPAYSCTNITCLKLHNGSVIGFTNFGNFGGTSNLNAIWFILDPDGSFQNDSSSIWGCIYYNGRITSWGRITPNTLDSGGVWNPGDYDPTWFSW